MEDLQAKPLAEKKEKKRSKKQKQEEKKQRNDEQERQDNEQGDDILMGSQSDGEDNTGNLIKNLLRKKTNQKLTTTNENLHRADNSNHNSYQSQFKRPDEPRTMPGIVASPMMGGYQPSFNQFRGSTFPMSAGMNMGFPRQMEPVHDGTIQIHIDVKIQKKGDGVAEKYTKMIPKYKFHEGDSLFISIKEFISFLVNNFLPSTDDYLKANRNQDQIVQSEDPNKIPNRNIKDQEEN